MSFDLHAIKSQLTDPQEVWAGLGLPAPVKSGNGWTAPCPAHPDRNPSASIHIRDGYLLWFCHACREGGSVLDALAAERGLDTRRDMRE